MPKQPPPLNDAQRALADEFAFHVVKRLREDRTLRVLAGLEASHRNLPTADKAPSTARSRSSAKPRTG